MISERFLGNHRCWCLCCLNQSMHLIYSFLSLNIVKHVHLLVKWLIQMNSKTDYEQCLIWHIGVLKHFKFLALNMKPLSFCWRGMQKVPACGVVCYAGKGVSCSRSWNNGMFWRMQGRIDPAQFNGQVPQDVVIEHFEQNHNQWWKRLCFCEQLDELPMLMYNWLALSGI